MCVHLKRMCDVRVWSTCAMRACVAGLTSSLLHHLSVHIPCGCQVVQTHARSLYARSSPLLPALSSLSCSLSRWPLFPPHCVVVTTASFPCPIVTGEHAHQRPPDCHDLGREREAGRVDQGSDTPTRGWAVRRCLSGLMLERGQQAVLARVKAQALVLVREIITDSPDLKCEYRLNG